MGSTSTLLITLALFCIASGVHVQLNAPTGEERRLVDIKVHETTDRKNNKAKPDADCERCPMGTFAFHGGSHCCYSQLDKLGEPLHYDTKSCKDDDYFRCPNEKNKKKNRDGKCCSHNMAKRFAEPIGRGCGTCDHLFNDAAEAEWECFTCDPPVNNATNSPENSKAALFKFQPDHGSWCVSGRVFVTTKESWTLSSCRGPFDSWVEAADMCNKGGECYVTTEDPSLNYIDADGLAVSKFKQCTKMLSFSKKEKGVFMHRISGTCERTDWSLSAAGAHECPERTIPLAQEECAMYAKRINREVESQDSADLPTGCFVNEENITKVFFNINSGEDPKEKTGDTLVCERRPYVSGAQRAAAAFGVSLLLATIANL